MRHFILSIAVALMAGNAHTASFDCAKASTKVEKLICADRELSELDDRMANAYEWDTEGGDALPRFRGSQKAWLAKRNVCADADCIRQRYDERIAELSCKSERMAGAAIGVSQCAWFSRRVLDRELKTLEDRQARKAVEGSSNADATRRALAAERKVWRDYRAARCALQGDQAGGADIWKNAFAASCEVGETEKRVAELRRELAEAR